MHLVLQARLDGSHVEIRRSGFVWQQQHTGAEPVAPLPNCLQLSTILSHDMHSMHHSGIATAAHSLLLVTPAVYIQSVSEEDDQLRELIHTERLVVKRASGRAIVNK